MKTEDKIERGKLAAAFIETAFYKKYLKPSIDEDIKNALNINKINEDDIEKGYLKQKIKADVYRGLIAKIETWKQEYNKLQGAKL